MALRQDPVLPKMDKDKGCTAMTKRFIEEQAKIIAQHIEREEVDKDFLVKHAELLLGYAMCLRDYDRSGFDAGSGVKPSWWNS